ncbi:MAG TPA: hypothetical protein VJ372_20065, partial [Pyrinomonadaceae bacterium]|nr:hypothetical protein [Pyrinomonadaceae bacterium]
MKVSPFRLLCVAAIIVVVFIARPALADSRDTEFEKMKTIMQDIAKTIKTLQTELSELKKERADAKQA